MHLAYPMQRKEMDLMHFFKMDGERFIPRVILNEGLDSAYCFIIKFDCHDKSIRIMIGHCTLWNNVPHALSRMIYNLRPYANYICDAFWHRACNSPDSISLSSGSLLYIPSIIIISCYCKSVTFILIAILGSKIGCLSIPVYKRYIDKPEPIRQFPKKGDKHNQNAICIVSAI